MLKMFRFRDGDFSASIYPQTQQANIHNTPPRLSPSPHASISATMKLHFLKHTERNKLPVHCHKDLEGESEAEQGTMMAAVTLLCPLTGAMATLSDRKCIFSGFRNINNHHIMAAKWLWPKFKPSQ